MKPKNIIILSVTVLVVDLLWSKCVFTLFNIVNTYKYTVAYLGGASCIIFNLFLCIILECILEDIDKKKKQKQYTDPNLFKWDIDNEDEELKKKGYCVLVVAGRTEAVQNFVEKLSYKIGYKCDFAMTSGRSHIDVYNCEDAIKKAEEAINDEEWMEQFIVPYSEESYNNKTYFEILK